MAIFNYSIFPLLSSLTSEAWGRTKWVDPTLFGPGSGPSVLVQLFFASWSISEAPQRKGKTDWEMNRWLLFTDLKIFHNVSLQIGLRPTAFIAHLDAFTFCFDLLLYYCLPVFAIESCQHANTSAVVRKVSQRIWRSLNQVKSICEKYENSHRKY